jgi:hypothetical protein
VFSPRRTAAVLTFLLFAAPARAAGVTVLFLGNSFTYVNDLPGTFAKVASSLGDRAEVEMFAPGAYTFERLSKDESAARLIKSRKWGFVVLQEQSQRPAFSDAQVAVEVVPYALKLHESIRANSARTRTVFYETWGRKDGDASNCKDVPEVCTYAGMQRRLTAAYRDLAVRTSAVLAPVGTAWAAVRLAHPEIELYAGDGIHPSPQGTYLAACVFYARLFGKSPAGADKLGLSAAEAKVLQEAAAEAVFGRRNKSQAR